MSAPNTSLSDDRSHALRGNASSDALRSALDGTRSVPGCIPTRSVGTITATQSEGFFEDLRITLIVVQRRPRRRQAIDAARHETSLTEPVGSPGGEHEQGFQALSPGAGFDALQQ